LQLRSQVVEAGGFQVSTKLYVGNLPWSCDEAELTTIMSEAGAVVSVSMPTDHATGRRRGFAFVEMESEEAAQAAIAKFDGQNIGSRPIVVNMAREKPPGGGGGGRRDRY